jgi:site-specific DNA-methyltransferase (adenine-specific)
MKLTIIRGDTFKRLPEIPNESIDLVITSPPYWGLRAYGTEGIVIGGQEDCPHEWESFVRPSENKRINDNTIQPKAYYEDQIQSKCSKCGAWKGEYGQEPTMEEYLDHTLIWVKEVWRVLKPTGSFVLNIGDCFVGGGRGNRASATTCMAKVNESVPKPPAWSRMGGFYKAKQFLSVSSFAYCRIISETDFVCRGEHVWLKPNVPSPIRTRLKHAHEKLFWFVKDAEDYYFDATPWLKKISETSRKRFTYPMNIEHFNTNAQDKETKLLAQSKEETIENSWRIVPVGARQNGFELFGKHKSEHVAPFPEELVRPYIKSLCPFGGVVLDPFLGSGTTMRIAMEENLNCIGIELSERYIETAKKRCNWGGGLGVEYDEIQ